MFDFIEGNLVSKSLTHVVINVNGLGFKIEVPLSTSKILKEGQHIRLLTVLYIKNERIEFYGFATETERKFFNDLIEVEGIGGRTALQILSNLNYDEFKSLVKSGKLNHLVKIKGLGRKTAERLIFTLKNKYKEEAVKELDEDALKALVALGIPYNDAREALYKAHGDTTEARVKNALDILTQGAPKKD